MNAKPNARTRPVVVALTIARVTWDQLLRDPTVFLVAGLAALLIATAPAYAVFQFYEARKVIVDTGLGTVLFAGLFLALLGPARVMGYELEDRTALTLLAKPLGRGTLLAGKYLGVLAAAAAVLAPLSLLVLYAVRWAEAAEDDAAGAFSGRLAALAGGGAVLAAAAAALWRRHRLAGALLALLLAAAAGLVLLGPDGRFRWEAGEGWGQGWPGQQPEPGMLGWRWEVCGGAVLVGMEVAVIAAVGTAAAVRLGAAGTLGVGALAVAAGHLRELLPGGLGGWALVAVPGLEAFSGIEAAAGGAAIPVRYLLTAGLYAGLYAAAALALGAALLERREVA